MMQCMMQIHVMMNFDFSNQILENDLEDQIVGMESQDCEIDEHVVESFVEVHSTNILDVGLCVDDTT